MSSPKIYLSSTVSDLQDYRSSVLEAVASAGGAPVAAELFSGSVQTTSQLLHDAVKSSDAVVLLLAHRYGALLSDEKISAVEFEYNVAKASGIPVLAFVLDEAAPWPSNLIDRGETAQKLSAFAQSLRMQETVETFVTPSDLALRVVRALRRVFQGRISKDAAEERSQIHGDDPALTRLESHLLTLSASFSELVASLNERGGANSRDMESPLCLPDVAPPAFLGPMAASEEERLCFIAMPYSKTWSDALQETLIAICKSEGYEILVARDMGGRFIPHDIWYGITRSKIIIADITDGNPNVAYEIGLADVLGKEVVLLCQNSQVPFDFLGQRLIIYSDTMKGSMILKEELASRLRRLTDRPALR